MELQGRSWADDVYDRRLLHAGATALDADAADIEAAAVVDACKAIGRAVGDELERLRAVLAGSPIEATLSPAGDGGDQIHAMVATVSDFDTAVRLSELLAAHDYRPWQTWTGGALESFRRSTDTLTVARTDERTDVVNITWSSGSALGRVPAVLRPNEADWSFVALPAVLWPLYFVVRPIRLIGERLGVLEQRASHLGPFLATPESLIDPLFEFAELTADDTVVDLGCGDGRLAIEAARRRGCRARGIETDRRLVDDARRAVSEAGLADLVTIEEGDAAAADLSEASAVFVFLPADVASVLIPEVVGQLRDGARVVAHEQHRIPAPVEPTRSSVLIGDGAITVAHRWG